MRCKQPSKMLSPFFEGVEIGLFFTNEHVGVLKEHVLAQWDNVIDLERAVTILVTGNVGSGSEAISATFCSLVATYCVKL